MSATFPRIYSLCTVGVRQHYNAEYLFHPVRTDFTGGNGLGKSIIADLMQLIIVPRRDMWKPGTEGIGKDERRVEGIPLNKEYIQYAYAFLNIEKKQGQFLTIGVYISKTPRIPVRPFIVQAGDEYELQNLVPFSRPLHPEDFISENNSIYDLRELIKFFREKHGLFMKDFFQTEGIMKYHDLLYKNNIVPVNLTKSDNLKTYAKVIQSFARAKSLDITNSKSLQNFLFEDNEEIKRTFEEQKEQLQSLIRQYRDNYYHTQELQLKQKKLLALQETFRKNVTAREEFLKSDATYAYNRYQDALARHEQNKNQILTSGVSLQQQKNELEKITQDLFRYYTRMQRVCLALKNKYAELLKEYSDKTILERKQHADALRDKINLLSSLEPFVEKYGSAEEMEKKVKEQHAIREKKNLLHKLFAISSFDDFEKSRWAKDDFISASIFYEEKLRELPEYIEELETLAELFEGTRDDSFFHWAIQQKQALSREQETVLMHLKEIPVGKPETFEEGTRYIANPSAIVNHFEKEKNGIWILFGEIKEFVPLVSKQRFTHPKNLKTILEKDTEEIKANLAEARAELETIQRLSAELKSIGFNRELSEIYFNREQIEQYNADTSLNEEKTWLVRQHWNDIALLQQLREEFSRVENQAIELAKKQSEIKGKLNAAKHSLDISEYEFTKLRLEKNLILPPDKADDIETGSVEELEKIKEKHEIKLKSINDHKTWTEKYIIAAESELKGYRTSEPVFEKQMQESLAVFNDKKHLFESETGLVFESNLLTGELNENALKKLEQKSNQLSEAYREEFTRVAETFEETKNNRNSELVIDKFNFQTLVHVLCGKLGLEGLGPELERLNEELKKFGELQLTIILDVFKKVEVQYNAFRKLTTELNFFFRENRISGVYNFQVDFNERRDISIDWIRKMREHARHQRLAAKLFITASPDAEILPEKLILNIAKTLSDVGDCEIEDLLDPKFYFELRVGLYDDSGNRYPGSGGEAYTALALLCIGRMSVIQRDKNRSGIRFIIIEELSNIDDTNFGLFPEIAKMFGYQLLTMTPKPFGSYTESEWYLHMLIRGKDKNINYHPMSFFRTRMSKQKLEEFMKGGTIEAKQISASFADSSVETIQRPETADEFSQETLQDEKTLEELPSLPQAGDAIKEERQKEFLKLQDESVKKKKKGDEDETLGQN